MLIIIFAILILLGYNSREQIEKAGKFKLFIFVRRCWKGFGMKQNYIPSRYFLVNVNKQAADSSFRFPEENSNILIAYDYFQVGS